MTQNILTLNNYLLNPLDKLASLIEGYKQSLREAHAVRSTIKELRNLTDKELHDIGITRGDIDNVAKRNF